MNQDEFLEQARRAGLNEETALTHGVKPLAAHAARLGQDAGPWLDALYDFVAILHARGVELWSPLRFTLMPLAEAADGDAAHFAALLDADRDLLMDLRDKNIETTRTEQYGVAAAARALAADGVALTRALEFARGVAAKGADPGWLLQTLVPALAPHGKIHERLSGLAKRFEPLMERKVFFPSPMADALATVAERAGDEAHWDRALDKLFLTLAALDDDKVVGFLRGGLDGSAPGGAGDDFVRALALCVTLADRRTDPTPFLQRVFRSSEGLALGEKLAGELCDPAPVLGGDMDVYAELGLLERGAERLEYFALALRDGKANGARFFEEGLRNLRDLDRRSPGVAAPGLALAERMIEKDLDPTLTLVFGLVWAIDGRAGLLDPARARAVIDAAGRLVDGGVDPWTALRLGVPVLVDECAGDAVRFNDLLGVMERLVTGLAARGADVQNTLFYDLQRLSNEGATPEAFTLFMRRLQATLALWTEAGAPVADLLGRGVTALALAAANKMWVMEAVFDWLDREGQAGRGGRAVRLLVGALAPVTRAAGNDRATFEAALAVFERALDRVPAEWTDAVAAASCALGGGDAAVLERVLRVVADRAKGPEELKEALPLLTEMAVDAESLGSLMDVAVGLSRDMPAERRRDWWGGAPETARLLAAGRPAEARALLTALAERAARWNGAGRWLLTRAAPTLAARLKGPAEFLDAMDALAEDAALWAEDPRAAGVALTCVTEAGTAAGVRRRLAVLRPALAGAERPAVVDGLSAVGPLVERTPALWDDVVAPVLARQGGRAGRVLLRIGHLREKDVDAPENRRALLEIIVERGVRAADALRHLIVPALWRGDIPSLGEDRALLKDYLAEVDLHEPAIYRSYRALVRDEALSRAEKKRGVEDLRRDITALVDGLRRGALTPAQEQSPLLGVALQHLFPPATSASVEDYVDIYRRFEDRPGDLAALGAERRFEVSLPGGAWGWAPGARVDLGPWRPFAPAPVVDAAPPAPEAEGWALLGAWTQGLLGREENQRELLARLTRRAGGSPWAGEAPSPAALIAVRDFAVNRLRDVIEEALLAAKAADGLRYERLVRQKLAPAAAAGKALVKGVAATVAAHRANKISREEAAERLGRQLQDFEISDPAPLLNAAGNEALAEMLARLPAKAVPLNAGVEVERVHQELVGPWARAMREALHGGPGRPGALTHQTVDGARTVVFEATKRRAHAAVGHAEGVCVAGDATVWNNPRFFQIVIWDETGRCAGGVHAMVVEEADGTYLTLPGINPGADLLAETSADVLLDRVVGVAWTLADRLGCRGVRVPTSAAIFSNRRAVHEAVAARGWPARGGREHLFSQTPYRYTFAETFDAPRPPRDGKRP
jgi:hypothetical protein